MRYLGTPPEGPLLLTGATGRLGRSVVSMVPEDRELRLLALPDDSAADALAHPGANVFRENLAHGGATLREAVAGVGAVVHMAAQLPRPGITNQQLFDSIVAGTFRLLEAMATEAPEAHLVYISSSAVYGPQLPPLSDPITEEHPVRPTSLYGAAKAAAEALVQASNSERGLGATVMRPSDIVIAEDVLSPDGFVGSRLGIDPESGVLRVPVDQSGNSATISFATATDVARGILLAASSEPASGQTYHVGPRRSLSDLEIAEAIADQRGWVVEKVDPSNGISRWVLDSTKAQAALDFEPMDAIDAITEWSAAE